MLPHRPSPGVLVTPGGVPIVPDWLQSEVYAITNRRGRVEWIAGAHTPYFGFKVRWRENDSRWNHVREGRMPSEQAYDLEQMFPRDCSMQDIAAYVRNHYGERQAAMTHADIVDEAERIVESARQQHAGITNGNIDRFTHDSTERSARTSRHERLVRAGAEQAHPMVSGGLTK